MYSKIFELHAELLKALAHPRRLEIIQLLRDQKLCVSDIYEMLDLPQANISQHLMILREVGAVSSYKEGKKIIYTVAHPNIIEACDLLREVLLDQYQNTELSSHLRLTMKDLVPIVHDPVCQMRLSPKTASYHTEYDNTSYYFCASGCLKKFLAKPDHYAKK